MQRNLVGMTTAGNILAGLDVVIEDPVTVGVLVVVVVVVVVGGLVVVVRVSGVEGEVVDGGVLGVDGVVPVRKSRQRENRQRHKGISGT